MLKVSQRIQQLDKMITASYQDIWDCCCDHGLLGMRLLKRRAADKIHFVDCIEQLTSDLQQQLQRFFAEQEFINRWQVYCLDAAKLPLTFAKDTANKKQLIIIAGIGGEQTITLVKAILTAHPQQELEFLLCPVHYNYALRQALTKWQLGLINETLLCENKRFYEIIHVSTHAKQPIASVGSIMWDLSRQDHQQYLKHTISHYQRLAKKPNNDVQTIINAYQTLPDNNALPI